MTIRYLLAAPLLALAFPVTANAITDTHTEAWAPPGKTSPRLYRPISSNNCRVQQHHVGNKSSLGAAPVSSDDCAAKLAQKAKRGSTVAAH
ncbi:MAG: hypothetical protein U5M50_06215 [Sphingobium sp.]|nr:hypothetical protein [Sphingobium sp.]